MSDFTEEAMYLRSIEKPHYNCGHAVIIPFAEAAGMSKETAFRLAIYFGGGFKRGSVCGAVAGGLVVLGLFGIGDNETAAEYYRRLQEKHKNLLDCSELLKRNEELGGIKKPFCDALICECISLAEEILKEKGKL